MALNLENLSNAALTATTLSNLILVSPQKNIGLKPTQRGNQSLNVPSLLFHYEGENTATLKSDITDHYVEDNTAINDHIALRPEIITVQGFIGELNNVTPEALKIIRLAAEKLSIINAFTPSLSTTALLAYARAEQYYRSVANTAENVVASWNTAKNAKFGTTTGQLNEISSDGLVTNNGNQTKQQAMFQQLYGYYNDRVLFTVQTPWAIFKNMAIQSLRAIQDAETNMTTDFEIEFKMIRFAKTEDVNAFSKQGRFSNQSSKEVNLGIGGTTPASPIGDVLSKVSA